MFEDLNKKVEKELKLRMYYEQERVILDITEFISELMQKKKVTQVRLANWIGVKPKQVLLFLQGGVDDSKITFRNIVDMFTVLDTELVIICRKPLKPIVENSRKEKLIKGIKNEKSA